MTDVNLCSISELQHTAHSLILGGKKGQYQSYIHFSTKSLHDILYHIWLITQLKASTIHVYSAAICNSHILHGVLPSPAQALRVKLALKAIYGLHPIENTILHSHY